MPEEDVVLRFGEEGAERVARSVERINDAFRRLGGPTSPSVAFVQSMSRGGPEVTRQTEQIERGLSSMSTQMRVGGRVAIALAANLSGQLDPALGKVASSLATGITTALAFGGAVGIVVAAVSALTSAVTGWVEESRKAEEFQIRLSRAVRTLDMGPVLAQLSEATLQSQKYGENTEELRQKIEDLRKTARFIFAQEEAPRLQLQLQQEQLGLARKIADTDSQRVQTVEEVTAALSRQQEATQKLAELQARQIQLQTEPRILQLREQGLEDIAQKIEAQAQARAEVVRGTARQEIEAQARAARDREIAITQEGMERGLAVLTAGYEQRATLQQAARDRELVELELSDRTALSSAQERQRIEEQNIRQTLDARLSAVNAEQQALQALAEAYPDVAAVQEQVDRRTIQLQQERVRAEVDANSQIIQQRRQMVERMREMAQQEAALGGGIVGQAQQRLAARGVTTFTREDIAREAEVIRRQGAEITERFARGEQVTAEELTQAQQAAPLFAQMGRLGTTAMGATGQLAAQLQAGFAGRQAPTAPGGGLLGIGEFDPTRMSFQEYEARLRLATAREEAGAVGPAAGLTTGLPGQIDQTLQQVEVGGTAVIERMLERIPPVLEGLFEKFVDGLIRKIEFEAARS